MYESFCALLILVFIPTSIWICVVAFWGIRKKHSITELPIILLYDKAPAVAVLEVPVFRVAYEFHPCFFCRQGLDSGSNDLIVKPFEAEVLKEKAGYGRDFVAFFNLETLWAGQRFECCHVSVEDLLQIQCSSQQQIRVGNPRDSGSLVIMGGSSSSQVASLPLKKPGAPIKHQHWAFNGPYAPVDEELFQTLKIRQGKLPLDLEGCYVRNGPNPLWHPPSETSNYHWFLGAGMVHAIRIKDGLASYNNHFLRTKSFLDDQHYGEAAFDKIAFSTSMTSFLSRLALEKVGLVRKSASGPSNTNLVFHASRLLALSEADCPMELKILVDGHLQSQAEYVYNNMWNAHPKIDPISGKLYWLDYDLSGITANFTYGVVDPEGKEERNCTGVLGGGKGVMIHDLGITEKYAIVIDCPVMVGIENYSTEGSLWKFDANHGSRIGIFPKDGENGSVQPTWFQIDTCWIFHLANAWEEGNTVVLIVVRWDRIDMSGHGKKDDFLTGNTRTLHEYRFDMDSGTVVEKSLAANFETLEFPVVNQKRVGRKTQFTWAVGNYENEPAFHRIFKFDLSASPPSSQSYSCMSPDGKKLTAGEAYFVSNGSKEDEGYLITFVVDPEGKLPSSFLILNGQNLETICVIDLPARIPLGFHGLWVSEQQVNHQIATKILSAM